MAQLGFTIWSKFIDNGIKEARREIVALDDQIRRMNSSFLIAQGRSSVFRTSLLALAPTAKTVGGVVVGGMAIIASATLGAAAAAGLYGKVMRDNMEIATAAFAAGEQLSSAQERYVKTSIKMRETWAAFVKDQEENTLTTATIAVEGLTAGIRHLKPIMDATAGIAHANAIAFRDWADSGEFGAGRLSAALVKYAVPALEHLAIAARNTLGGLGYGFREALKYAPEMSFQIRLLSEQFNMWAINDKGFKRFFDFVRENADMVKEFFKALWDAFMNIGKALTDLAPTVLVLVTAFLKMIAAMPTELIQGLYVAFLSLSIIAVVAAQVGRFTAALAFLATPAGLVVAAVAAVAAGLVYLAVKTDFFQTDWPVIWARVKEVAEPPLIWLRDTVVMLGNVFHDTFTFIRHVINGEWNEALGVFNASNKTFSEWALESWKKFKDAMKTDVFEPLGQTLREEEAIWEADFASTWQSFKDHMRTEWEMMLADAKTIVPELGKTLREEEAQWEADGQSFWERFREHMKTTWNKIVEDARSIIPQVGQTLGEESAIWKSGWDSMWTWYSTRMSEAWTLLKNDITGSLAGVRTALQEEEALWEIEWFEVWRSFGETAKTEWENIKTDFTTILPNIRTALNEEEKIWDDDWTELWTGLVNTNREQGELMIQDVKSMGSNIGTSLREEGSQWAQGWSDLWNGFTSKNKEAGTGILTDVKSMASGIGSTLSQEGNSWREGWDSMWAWLDKTNKAAGSGILNDIKSMASSIGTSLREEGSIWKADWDGMWSSVTSTLKGEWEEIKRETSAGIDAIGRWWASLPQKVREPVQWIVDVVWNDGLRAGWNWINDLWDGTDVGRFTFAEGGGVVGGGGGQQAFASGGPVRGRGTGTSDSINARLSNNEHVWTAREVKAAGGHGAMAAMRSAVLGGERVRALGNTDGFALGGGFFKGALSAISPSGAASLTAFEAWEKGMRGTINSAGGFATKMVDMAKRLPGKALDKVLDFVRNKLAPIMGSGMGWQQLWDIVRGAFPDATLTSALRPGDPGFHGSGNAIDVAWPMTEGGKAKMLELNKWLANRYPNSTELIHTPGVNLKNGKAMNYSSATQAQHWNHVHWAMAGGMGGQIGSADGWRTLVMQELAHFGQSTSLTDLVLRRINQESGGNARAINNWDDNAKKGTPSKGLMQVIDPTFAGFKNTSAHPDDIWDPGANMHAAFNWAMFKYGSLENAFNRAGGYYGGTFGARSGLSWVGEHGPELVRFRGGEQVFNQDMLGRISRASASSRSGGNVINVDNRGATIEAVEKMDRDVLPKLSQILTSFGG